MRYLKGITLVLIVCLLPFAKAEEKKESSALELIPVYEKIFDDTIVDVLFDTATVTIEEAKGMGYFNLEQTGEADTFDIVYPRVLIKKGCINFMNRVGEIEKEYKLKLKENLKISKNGKFLCVSKPTKIRDGAVPLGEVTIFDISSTEICRIENVKISGNSTNLRLPPNDKWILFDVHLYDDGLIELYDYNGAKKQIKICNVTDESASIGEVSFSQNGEIFVTTANNGASVSDTSYLLIYDVEGREIWRKFLKDFLHNYYTNAIISPQGKLIAVLHIEVSEDWSVLQCDLEIWNIEGALIMRKQLATGNYFLRFSKNGEYLVASNFRGLSYLFDTSGQLLWKNEEVSMQKGNRHPLDVSNDGDVLTYILHPTKVDLCLYKKSGQKILERNFSYSKGTFEVKFLDNDKSILIKNNGNIQIYRMK